MIEDDTIKLLRECNAGVKMGISSLDDVMDHVRDQNLKNLLMQIFVQKLYPHVAAVRHQISHHPV